MQKGRGVDDDDDAAHPQTLDERVVAVMADQVTQLLDDKQRIRRRGDFDEKMIGLLNVDDILETCQDRAILLGTAVLVVLIVAVVVTVVVPAAAAVSVGVSVSATALFAGARTVESLQIERRDALAA